jgi:hypothetical protein
MDYHGAMMNRTARTAACLFLLAVAPKVRADTKSIAIIDVENQAGLEASDIGILEKIVTEEIRTAPKDFYTVDTVYLGVMESGCDDACIVKSAKSSGADFAVHISVSTFGHGYMVLVRLFDTQSGQLLASETASSDESLAALAGPLETAAKKVRRSLPDGDLQRAHAGKSGKKAGRFSSLLIVTSNPSGAKVYLGGGSGTRYVGKTPFKKELPPRRYRVKVYKKDYNREKRDASLYAGETKEVHFELYRSRRLMTAGHGFLWPGLILTAMSVAFFTTDLDPGGIPTAAVGGTFIAAGATLLITGGVRLKKEKAARKQALVPAAHPHGLGLSYTLVF